MPAVSQAQRALIFARFGKAFAKKHHFDNKGPLPEHAGGKTFTAAQRKTLASKGKK